MRFQTSCLERLLLTVLAAVTFVLGDRAGADPVRTIESQYYTLTGDLTPDEMRGILMRLDYLIPEYNQNFPALRGAMTHKFAVNVYRDVDAFHAAGAPRDTTASGYHPGLHRVFILLGNDFEHNMHEMQYHCFLQFCNEAIANDQQNMPAWMLLGLGRHFRWARFTGDGYVCGLIPWHVVEDTQQYVRDGRYRDVTEVLGLTRDQIYRMETFYVSHEAWWVAHYLDCGENGIRHEAFSKYLHDVARGISHKEAWKKAFGDLDINRLWKEWMMAQKPDILKEGYAQALAQTLSAYLGRASLSGQRFTRLQDLMESINNRTIRIADADWLPPDLPSLFRVWMELAGADTRFEISPNTRTPQVIALLADRTRIVATFDPSRKGARTIVEIDGPGHPKRTGTDKAPDAAGAATIVLKSARFGAGDNWVDVTEKCKSMIVGDMMLAPRSLSEALGVNPAPAGTSLLELQLVVNGASVRMLIADNKRLAPFRLTTQLPMEMDE